MLSDETKRMIIHRWAHKQSTQQALADEYGVTVQTVNRLCAMNRDLIERVREEIRAEVDELWISKQVNRVAVHQHNVERLLELADRIDDEKVPLTLKEVRNTLRAVAEELGQLAPKTVDVGNPVTVRLEGVDTDAL